MWISERAVAGDNVCGLSCGHQPEATRLRGWVEHLAVPRHLFANAADNAWVRDELAAALQGLGLTVQIQGRYQNVIALPREADRQATTIIAAHYDSVPDCPGADDNASGLAVLLECARVLRDRGEQSALGFVAFNAEEDGLLGSRDFVEQGLPRLRTRVRAVHVLEMVGFRQATATQELPLPWVPHGLRTGDFIGLLAKGGSNAMLDRALSTPAAPGLRLLGAKTWGPLHRLLPDLTRSDHFPFWHAGIPALLWTDTGNFRNPNYHRRSDTPDTLDYRFMREVAELLCAVIAGERRCMEHE